MKLISPSRAEKRLVVIANVRLEGSDLSHVGLEHISSHDTGVLASSTVVSSLVSRMLALASFRLPLARRASLIFNLLRSLAASELAIASACACDL